MSGYPLALVFKALADNITSGDPAIQVALTPARASCCTALERRPPGTDPEPQRRLPQSWPALLDSRHRHRDRAPLVGGAVIAWAGIVTAPLLPKTTISIVS